MSQYQWTWIEPVLIETGDQTKTLEDKLQMQGQINKRVALLTLVLVHHASNVEQPITGKTNVQTEVDNSISLTWIWIPRKRIPRCQLKTSKKGSMLCPPMKKEHWLIVWRLRNRIFSQSNQIGLD